MSSPKNLRYTPSHEWIETQGLDRAVGLTDHAQAELGDLVYIELPIVGRKVKAQEQIAVVESVKAAGEVYAPVDGEITAVNDLVATDSSLVNSSPWEDGWLYRLKPDNAADVDALLDAATYDERVGG